jgi:hypothetical protein
MNRARFWNSCTHADTLNSCYDDNGYVMHAPDAHAAKLALCDVLDDIVGALRDTP